MFYWTELKSKRGSDHKLMESQEALGSNNVTPRAFFCHIVKKRKMLTVHKARKIKVK